MKEIKFRAWISKPADIGDGYELRGMEYNVRPINSKSFILNSGFLCIDAEIMQYTGLKDKNGEEIYEGDIVRTQKYNDTWNEGAIGDIYFKEAQFRVGWKILLSTKEKKHYREDFSTICSHSVGGDTERYEVIGNIYENKELLE